MLNYGIRKQLSMAAEETGQKVGKIQCRLFVSTTQMKKTDT